MRSGRYSYKREDVAGNRNRSFFRRGLYRSREGLIFGVCRGISDYLGFSLFWTRVIVVALFLITGFWPTGIIYIVAALLMKPAPVTCSGYRKERASYDSYGYSGDMKNDYAGKDYSDLEKRIRRMERSAAMTEFDWERRLYS